MVEDTHTQSSMMIGAFPSVMGENLDGPLVRMRMRHPLWRTRTNRHRHTPSFLKERMDVRKTAAVIREKREALLQHTYALIMEVVAVKRDGVEPPKECAHNIVWTP